MRRIGQLLLFIGLGLVIAWSLHVDVGSLAQSQAYKVGAYLLLAIGLYGATYGIDLRQAAYDKKIIVSAVTIGVIAKALIIGGSLALAWHQPLFLILGVVVAQIDPLSVASLMGDGRMSPRARNVLAAWSSFDDPFTVVLSIYAAAVAVNTFSLGNTPPSATNPLLLYAADLSGNLVLAGLAWLLWRIVRRGRPWLQYAMLLLFVAAAVATGWMLAIAIIGLFARPTALDKAIPRITTSAMYVAALALGVLLIGGIDPWRGISLGVTAFFAQAVVAIPLTRHMPPADRWHLAGAQQHGITAIILALTLEIQFDGVVAIVAPAIIAANIFHVIANALIERRLRHRPRTGTAPAAPGQRETLASESTDDLPAA